MNIFWLLDIDHESGLRQGATLRYVNFSRGLIARGHRVYFLVYNRPGEAREARNEYLEALRKDQCLTGFYEIDDYSPPPFRRRLGRLAIHPGFRNWLLAPEQAGCKKQIRDLATSLGMEVCIISQRRFFFLLPELSKSSLVILDWCDSHTLRAAREIRLMVKTGRLRNLLSEVNALASALIDEMFYGRYSAANLAVSAIDKEALDRLNGNAMRNYVVGNGVSFPAEDTQTSRRDPNRLIFTGSMNFGPNFEGALWFIRNVMPLLIQRNKDVRLVIAGQNPVPELVAEASEHVEITGLVPDMHAEIARCQLYVAPIVSGSGFRNKVVEALASGTFVIGTPMALEFLPEKVRRRLLTASTADEFATGIEKYLKNPGAFDVNLDEAVSFVRNEYQWSNKVKELENLCYRSVGPFVAAEV